MTTCIFDSSKTPYKVLVTADNSPPDLPNSVPKGTKIKYTLIGGGGAGYGDVNKSGGGGGSGETRTGFIIADTNFIINVGIGGTVGGTVSDINGKATNIYSGINKLASAGGGFGAVDLRGGMGGNGALGGQGGLGPNNAGPAQTKTDDLGEGYYSTSNGGGGGSDAQGTASDGAEGGTRGINGKNSGGINVYGAGGGGGGPGGGGGGGGAATGKGIPGPGGIGKPSSYGLTGQNGGTGFLGKDGGDGGYGGYGGSDSGGGGGGGGKPISGGTSVGGDGGSGLAILKVIGYVNLNLNIQGNLCAGKESPPIGTIKVFPSGGTLVVKVKWDDNNKTEGRPELMDPNTYSLFVTPPKEAKFYVDVLITCEYTVGGDTIISETITNIDTRETVNFTLNHDIEGCSPQILGIGSSKCYELDTLEAKYSLDNGVNWLPATVDIDQINQTFTVQPTIINPGGYDIIVKIFNDDFSETFKGSITVGVGFTLNCSPFLQTSTCSKVIGLGIGTCCGSIALTINYTQTEGGLYDETITPTPPSCQNRFYSVSFDNTLGDGTYYLKVIATSQDIILTDYVTLIILDGKPTLNVRNIKVCPTVIVLVGNGVTCSSDITAEVLLDNNLVPNPILSFGKPPNNNRYFINIQAPISPGEYDMLVRIKDGGLIITRQAKLIVQNYFFVEVLNQTYCEDYNEIKIAVGHECPPGNIESVTWDGVDIKSHCQAITNPAGDFSVYTTYKALPGIYNVIISYGLENNTVSSSGTITISPTLKLNTFNLRVCEKEDADIILATGISCNALTGCQVTILGENTECYIQQHGRYFTISGKIPNSEGVYPVKVKVFMGDIHEDSEFTLSVTPYLNIFPSDVVVCQGITSAVVGYGISCQRGIVAHFNEEDCDIQYHGDMFTITANNINLIPGIYTNNTLTITYDQGGNSKTYKIKVTVIPKVNIIPENNFICKGGEMIRVATGITCGEIDKVKVKWEGDTYPSEVTVLDSKRYSVIAKSPKEPGYYEGTVTVTDKDKNSKTEIISVLVQCGFTLISKERIVCPGKVVIAEGTVCNYKYPTEYKVTWNPPFDGEYTLENKCSSYKIFSDTPNSGSYKVTIKVTSEGESKEVISDITISGDSSLQAVSDSTIKCQTETVVAIICSGCSVEIFEPSVKWNDVVYKSKIVENRIISEVPKESGKYKVDVSLGSSSVSLDIEVRNEIELMGLDLTMKQGCENVCVAVGSYPCNMPSICVTILGKTIPSVIKPNGSMFSVYCDININKPGKYEICVGNRDIWVVSNLEVLGTLVVLGMDKRRLEVKSLSKHPYVFNRKEKIKMIKLDKNLYILDGNYLGYTLTDDINYLSLNEHL